MRFFSSKSLHKVDDKGRVSIPAMFRKVIDADPSPALFLIPGLRNEPCIEGLSAARFEALAESLDVMSPLDVGGTALANKIMGEADQIAIEDTGRIILPKEMRKFAQIGGEALFVGLGKTFQIWNRELYEARKPEMERLARENFDRLPWGGRASA